MIGTRQPYLIIPKLIEQPTWGSQSYELFSRSRLRAENGEIDLSELIWTNPTEVLGEEVYNEYGKMPLLIKLNKARGNSFQLHISPKVRHSKWRGKPESWYFFEKGKLTCGIKPGTSLIDYKNGCREIEREMHNLSKRTIDGEILLEEAKISAQTLIKKINPWQYVQIKEAEIGDIYDLSQGGIHHSWEEDFNSTTGNVVYEVQLDVADEVSTIRAFDQGKFLENGTVRDINIDDYFEFLDSSEETNSENTKPKKAVNGEIFLTDNYQTKEIKIINKITEKTNGSFCHLFVKMGAVAIEAEAGRLEIAEKQSCFIPSAINSFEIIGNGAEVLKTYVPVER